jgi:hypothetical protein
MEGLKIEGGGLNPALMSSGLLVKIFTVINFAEMPQILQ